MSVWFFRRTGSEVMAARRRTALSSVLVAALLLVMLLPGESNSIICHIQAFGKETCLLTVSPSACKYEIYKQKNKGKK